MKYPIFITLIAVIGLTSFVSAQNVGDVKTPTSTKEVVTDDDKRVAKNIADAKLAAAERLARKAVDPDYLKVLEIQKKHAAYLADVAEGKVRPFQNIVDNWSSYMTQVGSLTVTYEKFLNSDSEEDKAKMVEPLLTALQPVGIFLRNGNHRGAKRRVLTENEFNEQDKLMNEFNNLESSDEDGKLELLTSNTTYTLRHVPITIRFSAPEGTEIMLQSELGGEFPNKMDYIRIVADENGLASTSWITYGDCAGAGNIIFRSPEYPTKGMITPMVKKLELFPLEQISPMLKKATLGTKSIINKAGTKPAIETP